MSLELLPELRIVEIGHATTEYAGKILAELGAHAYAPRQLSLEHRPPL